MVPTSGRGTPRVPCSAEATMTITITITVIIINHY